ncbi:hypothetical protein BCD48_03280 [Pseudofrankia sp. BMG5.36]|nr:hypothetical protein BCD48_03280 [Pseudofrankia sp. BMG5.36]
MLPVENVFCASPVHQILLARRTVEPTCRGGRFCYLILASPRGPSRRAHKKRLRYDPRGRCKRLPISRVHGFDQAGPDFTPADQQQRADSIERGFAVSAGDQRLRDVQSEGDDAGKQQQTAGRSLHLSRPAVHRQVPRSEKQPDNGQVDCRGFRGATNAVTPRRRPSAHELPNPNAKVSPTTTPIMIVTRFPVLPRPAAPNDPVAGPIFEVSPHCSTGYHHRSMTATRSTSRAPSDDVPGHRNDRVEV